MKVKVVGTTFSNEEFGVNRQEIIATLSGKEKIYLKREPENRFDSNAVAVILCREKTGDFKLGYIRAELAAFFSSFWDKYKFFARISEIRTGDLKKKVPYGLSVDVNYVIRKESINFHSSKKRK